MAVASSPELAEKPTGGDGSAGSDEWTRPNPSEENPTHERVLTDEEGEVETLLGLLDDDHAKRILACLDGEPRPARELVDACEASRATVYRRLNRLEEHGLVSTDVEFHRDGHHRKVFTSTFERATFELVDGAPQVRLVLAAEPESEADGLPRQIPAD